MGGLPPPLMPPCLKMSSTREYKWKTHCWSQEALWTQFLGWPFESFVLAFSHVAVRLALAITVVPGFLASSCNHCGPWIFRVWLRCSVCLLSALLYLYRNESVWKKIPGYPLNDDERLELYYIIYDLKQLPRAYYFLCQELYTWYWWKVMWRVVQHPSHQWPNRMSILQ